MPNPTQSQIRQDRFLTNLSVAFSQDKSDYVADRVFPEIGVQEVSGLYPIYDRDDWNRIEVEKRGLSSESAGGGFNLSNDNYLCETHSLHKDLDRRLVASQQDPVELRRDTTAYLTEQHLKNKDKQWATNFFTTGVWDTDTTPSTLWSAGGSDPIGDIETQMLAVKKATGFKPNKLVLGAGVWSILKHHADFVGRVDGGAVNQNPAMASLVNVAAVLGLEEIMVAEGVENTAAEGATESSAFIVGEKSALLVYVAPRPGILTPSAGYTFRWDGMPDGTRGNSVRRFERPELWSDRIEMDMSFDQKVVATELGVFFDGAVA